jgi:hypothetical protein
MDKVNACASAVITGSENQKTLDAAGINSKPMIQLEFANFVHSETDKWGEMLLESQFSATLVASLVARCHEVDVLMPFDETMVHARCYDTSTTRWKARATRVRTAA